MFYEMSSLPNRLRFALAFTLGFGIVSVPFFIAIFLSPVLLLLTVLSTNRWSQSNVDTGVTMPPKPRGHPVGKRVALEITNNMGHL